MAQSEREEEECRAGEQRYDFGVVRELRQRRGWSIQHFASVCGVSYAPISRLETNRVRPSLESLDKIADAFGLSTTGLMALAERKGPRRRPTQITNREPWELHIVELDSLVLVRAKTSRGGVLTTDAIPQRPLVHLSVTRGEIIASVGGREERAGIGETLTFLGALPEAYRAPRDCDMSLILDERTH